MRLWPRTLSVQEHKPIAVVYLSVLLFSSILLGHATTIVVVITDREIVVGSDSKQVTTAGNTQIGTSTRPKKAELVANNRIVVAVAGLDQGGEYEFSRLIRNVSDSLPKDISVKDFVAAFEKKSAAELHFLDSLLGQGMLTPSRGETCRTIAEYLVAGYENGKPWAYLIRFYVDWDSKRLVGPKTTVLHAPEINSPDRDMFSIGVDAGTKDLLNRNSYAYKQAARLVPNAFAKVLSGGDLNESEAIGLIRAQIHIEEEIAPSEVGGYGQFLRIQAHTGTGSVIGPKRGDARKTLTKPAHSAANK